MIFTTSHVPRGLAGQSVDQLEESMSAFNNQLENDIAESASKWLKGGYFIANSLSCSLLGYGRKNNVLMQAISESDGTTVDSNVEQASLNKRFHFAFLFSITTIRIMFYRVEDPYILPFAHVILVFVDYMAQNLEAMAFIEKRFLGTNL
ncbi:hypothetical protein FPOA_13135 [Fusarium poae]|uniref:Uncharacterized protein n=1 Tax=Fusarium poae TaxID=36050 RepID=A0A1B8A6R5_FUSPO|nr:hypothetical protein FPOA_13135 [Fusarium poae]